MCRSAPRTAWSASPNRSRGPPRPAPRTQVIDCWWETCPLSRPEEHLHGKTSPPDATDDPPNRSTAPLAGRRRQIRRNRIADPLRPRPREQPIGPCPVHRLKRRGRQPKRDLLLATLARRPLRLPAGQSPMTSTPSSFNTSISNIQPSPSASASAASARSSPLLRHARRGGTHARRRKWLLLGLRRRHRRCGEGGGGRAGGAASGNLR